MLRLAFSSILFLAITSAVFAQNLWTVSGSIRGDQGEPLVGSSVYVDGVFQSAADVRGAYSVTLKDMPRLVTIRYLGYYPQRNTLEEKDFRDKKVQLDFTLVNQEPALGEVTITAKPIETIVQEDFTTDLYDYGFVGRNLLLLLREKKRFFLRLMQEDGEVLSQLRLPEECHLLHKSCIGDFHVVGTENAWEVSIKGQELDTLPHYPAENFHRFVEPCSQLIQGQYYFVKHGTLNQSLKYLVFEDKKPPRVAFEIEDKKGMEVAQQALQDFFDGKPMIYRTPLRTASTSGADEILATWGKFGDPNTAEGLTSLSGYGADQIYRISELEAIRRDSIYAPLLKINDTLCLFDHVNSRIVRFGPGLERTDVITMTYHFAKGWEKLILHDAQNNRVYARFSDNKGLVLKEIDAKTGRAGKTYQLALAPYVSEKFRIRNGMLYFIGQPDVNTPNKMLYKMNIFAGQVK